MLKYKIPQIVTLTLSGSTQVDADSAISELVFYKKLYIEIEYATPPNIKANFYKEVSIKRR